MSDIALRIEHLSKEYRIGARQKTYRTVRDTIAEVLSAPLRRVSKLVQGQAAGAADLDERTWALKDVSLEIKRGEVVGLIGRNGAGKSTLLKILSRITEPTQGRASIHGRVGSLLEVGTGFHGELTGRENIYLNGAILGMKRREITRKFDEIVAFADVEKFIDTPVKHYSTGMYLRLAFAVAAHLEPEILLVDEVLAVGDARFQQKCLNKMHEVGQQGRTVLFVSHSMPAITRLCRRAILLEDGTVSQDGLSHQVVSAYLQSDLGTIARREWSNPAQRPGQDITRLCAVQVQTEQGEVVDSIDIRKSVGIEMKYEVLKSDYVLMPYYRFFNEEGIIIFVVHDTDVAWRRRPRPAGYYTSTVWIPGNLLAEGMIIVTAGLTTLNPSIHQFFESQVVAFQVVDTLEGDSARGDWGERMRGVVRPLLEWTTEFVPNGQGAVMALEEEKGKL